MPGSMRKSVKDELVAWSPGVRGSNPSQRRGETDPDPTSRRPTTLTSDARKHFYP
jgi:hypothetical protein